MMVDNALGFKVLHAVNIIAWLDPHGPWGPREDQACPSRRKETDACTTCTRGAGTDLDQGPPAFCLFMGGAPVGLQTPPLPNVSDLLEGAKCKPRVL